MKPLLFALLFSFPIAFFTQDPPIDNLPKATSVDEWTEPATEVPGLMGARFPDRPVVQRVGFYSKSLKGLFQAQWMYIEINGRRHEFWGARILRLESASPIRSLGLTPGDVITRLDGTPISTGLQIDQSGSQRIPELDQHYGKTEIRFIVRGTQQVRIGDVMLDGAVNPDEPILP